MAFGDNIPEQEAKRIVREGLAVFMKSHINSPFYVIVAICGIRCEKI